MNAGSPEELLGRIVGWARADPNVVALVMTGSRARQAQTVDQFSDFDLEIIADDAGRLATDDEWLRSFGRVWVCLPLSEDQPYPTRLVFYDGAMKVDFSLCTRKRITDMAAARALDDLYERGYRVLIDKEGITAALPEATGAFPARELPGRREFTAVVDEFWFEAAHIPGYLQRGELWVVKMRDWTMKQLLLRMLEWHATARRAGPVDVWHIGAHMREWVDETTWQDLRAVYAHFDAEDSWAGLIATIDLFRRLTRETAAAIGIEYPGEPEESISRYIAVFKHGR